MSGRASKAKGYKFEVELVADAEMVGLEAKRAWGSNGKALGHAETVDLEVAGVRVQAKRRKEIAKYLYPPEGSDVQVFRADHQQALAVLPWKDYLVLLKMAGRP